MVDNIKGFFMGDKETGKKGLFSFVGDFFGSKIIDPLRIKFFGTDDKDGNNDGKGIFNVVKQAFMDKIINPISNQMKLVIMPYISQAWRGFKDWFIGKKNKDGTYRDGLMSGMIEKSKELWKTLGDKVLGKSGADGKRDESGWLNSKTKGVISKYGKGAGAGVIGSSIFSMIAFPINPWIGSLLGMAYQTETAQKWLYGEDGKGGVVGKFKEKFKEVYGKVDTYLFGEKDEKGRRTKVGVLTNTINLFRAKFDILKDKATKFLYGAKDASSEFLKQGLFPWVKEKWGVLVNNTKTYLFGKEDPTTGKRTGGVFSELKKVGSYIGTQIKETFNKDMLAIKKFWSEQIVTPMKAAFEPFITEFKIQFTMFKKWGKEVFVNGLASVKNAIDTIFKDTFGKSLSEMMIEYVVKPIQKTLDTVKNLIGNIFKQILMFPINIIKKAAADLKDKHRRAGMDYAQDTDEEKKKRGWFGRGVESVKGWFFQKTNKDYVNAAKEVNAGKMPNPIKDSEKAKEDELREKYNRESLDKSQKLFDEAEKRKMRAERKAEPELTDRQKLLKQKKAAQALRNANKPASVTASPSPINTAGASQPLTESTGQVTNSKLENVSKNTADIVDKTKDVAAKITTSGDKVAGLIKDNLSGASNWLKGIFENIKSMAPKKPLGGKKPSDNPLNSTNDGSSPQNKKSRGKSKLVPSLTSLDPVADNTSKANILLTSIVTELSTINLTLSSMNLGWGWLFGKGKKESGGKKGKGIFGGIIDIITAPFRFVGNFFKKTFETIGNVATNLANTVGNIIGEISKFSMKLISGLWDGLKFIGNGIKFAVEGIGRAVSWLGGALIDGIGKTFTFVMDIASSALNVVGDIVKGVFESVTKISGMIVDSAFKLVESIGTATGKIFEFAVNSIPVIIDGVGRLAKGIVDATSAIFRFTGDLIISAARIAGNVLNFLNPFKKKDGKGGKSLLMQQVWIAGINPGVVLPTVVVPNVKVPGLKNTTTGGATSTPNAPGTPAAGGSTTSPTGTPTSNNPINNIRNNINQRVNNVRDNINSGIDNARKGYEGFKKKVEDKVKEIKDNAFKKRSIAAAESTASNTGGILGGAKKFWAAIVLAVTTVGAFLKDIWVFLSSGALFKLMGEKFGVFSRFLAKPFEWLGRKVFQPAWQWLTKKLFEPISKFFKVTIYEKLLKPIGTFFKKTLYEKFIKPIITFIYEKFGIKKVVGKVAQVAADIAAKKAAAAATPKAIELAAKLASKKAAKEALKATGEALGKKAIETGARFGERAASRAIADGASKQAAKAIGEKAAKAAINAVVERGTAKAVAEVGGGFIAKQAAGMTIRGFAKASSAIPVVGPIINGILGLVFNALDSRGEKGLKKVGTVLVGNAGDSMATMLLNAGSQAMTWAGIGATIGAIGGPVGIGVGGLIGGVLGFFGGLFGSNPKKSMDNIKLSMGGMSKGLASIGDSIMNMGKSIGDWFANTVEFLRKWFVENFTWKKIGETLNPLNWFKPKKDDSQPTQQPVTNTAQTTNAFASKPINNILGAFSSKPIFPANNAPTNPMSSIGRLSAKYESGGKGSGAVSSGKNDPGGVSYGKYQIKRDNVKGFISWLSKRDAGYAAVLARAGEPGSPLFNDTWKNLNDNDPKKFESLQDQFIKSQYYDNATPAVLKATGVDISGRSDALKATILSTIIQHGKGSEKSHKGLVDIIKKAGITNDMSDNEMIRRIYDERSNRTAKRFPKMKANRYEPEKKDALAMLGGSTSSGVASSVSQTSTTYNPPVLNDPPKQDSTGSVATGKNLPGYNAAILKSALGLEQSASNLTYEMGGDGSRGTIDCSHFVSKALNSATNGEFKGYLTSAGFTTDKRFTDIPKEQRMPGDLLTLPNNHVMIYLGDGKVVDSSPEGGGIKSKGIRIRNRGEKFISTYKVKRFKGGPAGGGFWDGVMKGGPGSGGMLGAAVRGGVYAADKVGTWLSDMFRETQNKKALEQEIAESIASNGKGSAYKDRVNTSVITSKNSQFIPQAKGGKGVIFQKGVVKNNPPKEKAQIGKTSSGVKASIAKNILNAKKVSLSKPVFKRIGAAQVSSPNSMLNMTTQQNKMESVNNLALNPSISGQSYSSNNTDSILIELLQKIEFNTKVISEKDFSVVVQENNTSSNNDSSTTQGEKPSTNKFVLVPSPIQEQQKGNTSNTSIRPNIMAVARGR